MKSKYTLLTNLAGKLTLILTLKTLNPKDTWLTP